MFRLQIPSTSILKGLKILFILLVIGLVGYLGYLTYYFATNQPKEIRVTNITGSSATISWYTERPDVGLVALKDKDSFISMLAGIGSRLGYDDRDYANALSVLADKATKNAQKDIDANYEVTLDSESLKSVKVSKKGKYYVHHVTLDNLSEKTQYSFRVGNGIFWWNVKPELQKYSTYEAPTVSTFSFKTVEDPQSIASPDPVFGRVYSLDRDNEGFLMQNLNSDSIVFLNAYKSSNGSKSSYLSAITNSEGGWTLDKSNIRNEQGQIDNTYKIGEDLLYAYAQLENVQKSDIVEMKWGVDDAPAPNMLVNNEAQANVNGSIFDKIKFSLESKKEIPLLNKISRDTYAACGRTADDQVCPSGTSWSQSRCDCVGKVTSTPTPTPPKLTDKVVTTRDIDAKNNCQKEGGRWANGKCDYSQEISQAAPAAPASSVSNSNPNPSDAEKPEPAQPSTPTPSTVKPTKTCPNGVMPNTNICRTNNNDKLSGMNLKCEGQSTKGCDLTDGCYCKWVNKNDPTDSTDYGYGRLDDTSCRPSSCASNTNGDYNGTEARIKKSTGLLCGTDTTSDGCTLNESKVARGGVLICATSEELVTDAKGVESCKPRVGQVTPTASSGLIKCEYLNPVTCTGNISKELSQADCDKAKTESNNKCSELVWCEYDDLASASSKRAQLTKAECAEKTNLATITNCTGVGKKIDKNGECTCDSAAGFSLVNGNCIQIDKPEIIPSGACKDGKDNFNCGVGQYDSNNPGTRESCSNKAVNNNEGCGIGYECSYVKNSRGYCVEKGLTVAFNTETEKKEINGLNQDCYALVNDTTGQVTQLRIVNDAKKIEDKVATGTHWVQMWVSRCIDIDKTVSLNNQLLVKNKISLIKPVNAASTVKTETQGNYLVVFPESGTYDVQIGDEKFSNIYVNKDNKHFFFVEKNGVSGYQLPEDGKTPKANEDILLPASGAVVTLYEKAKNQSLKLDKGINIVSFNYLPSRVEGQNMKAKQLMKILNSSGNKVSRITTFEGGKWLGGIALNQSNNEIAGTDFSIIPGKGYLIVSNSDGTHIVPGYGIKNSVPVALSSGWNLIGVNGFKKTYTASTLIDSVNTLSGVKANNLTWWPTSKGRYETFQKSEGVEYGFDFPVLKDVGYFLRVSEFAVEDESAKSVIWNPGGDLHGEFGSGKTK